MFRQGKVYYQNTFAGTISETAEGFCFEYDESYLNDNAAESISLTLPTTSKIHTSKVMFSFFDGLIPEGWLLDIATETWKIDSRDRMGLLLSCCKECIGAVSVFPAKADSASPNEENDGV